MVTHKGTMTLETPRLLLRRCEKADAKAMFNNWASDPEVTRYLTWPTHPNTDITEAVLSDWVECYAEPNYYHWLIVLKTLGEPIGSMAVVQLDDNAEKAEIGYCIGRNWWHQGITSEALKAVMDFLFDEVGMNRVEARHDPRNPNSGAVMRKCGMKYEGTHRQADRNNQGICDVSIYALLKSERNK